MAGGEGTRLRPLTSNQPKPMVPICGKPCIEHIVELLRRHDVVDIVVTLAFLPQAIRSYLGNGSGVGVRHEYWQDIGTLEQYRRANEDVLDGRCHVNVPGIRLKENIWLGDGVALPAVDVIEGPAYLGNYCKIAEGARVGPYAVLGSNVSVQ